MLAIALMASISIYAQTSEWQQQLEQLLFALLRYYYLQNQVQSF